MGVKAVQSGSTSDGAGLRRVLCVVLLLVCLGATTLAAPMKTGCEREPGEGEICCGGRVFEKSMDKVCCQLQGYSEGEKAYVLWNRCVNGYAANPLESCAGRDYDTRHDDCCGGHTIFALRKDQCCSGDHKATVLPKHSPCCNGEAMSPGQMCCTTSTLNGSIPLHRPDHLHTECCVPQDLRIIPQEGHGITTYNPDTHKCSYGKIDDLSEVDNSLELFLEYNYGESESESEPESLPPSESSKTPPPPPLSEIETPDSKPDPESESLSSDLSTLLRSVKTRSKNKQKISKHQDKSNKRPKNEDFTEQDVSCLRGGKKKEEGESLRCCGGVPFRLSVKSCCRNTLHYLPTPSSQCCYDEAFMKGDPANPCTHRHPGEPLTCAGKPLNVEIEICCRGKVFTTSFPGQSCCGAFPERPATHQCCGGMLVPKSSHSCCKDTMPYIPTLMRCDGHTSSVSLRTRELRKQSIPEQFCRSKLTLPTWDHDWRALVDPKMLKIQGRVDSCGIRVRKNILTIPLTPAVAIVGGHRVFSCLQDNGLKLTIQLPCTLNKHRMKKIRNFFRRLVKVLEVFIPENKLQCRKGWGVVKLGEREAVLLLRSKKMDKLLEEASLTLS